MNQDEGLNYRGAVVFAEVHDAHPHHIDAPLRQNELHAAVTAIVSRGGMVVESTPRRLYGLFAAADAALACAEDLRHLVIGARDAATVRRDLGFRLLLGYGTVRIHDGRIRSDWTFRLPSQLARLPLNGLGATAEFAQQMGAGFTHRLQALPGSDLLYSIVDPDRATDVTRLAPALDLAGAPVFSTLTLHVRGVARHLRSSDCPVTLGRDPGCGIVVASDTASRVHGRIEFDHGKFVYLDSSRNGSYVLTAAGEELFLLQEKIALVGEGAISPGAPLSRQNGEVVRYQCQSSRLSMDDATQPLGRR